MGLDQLLAALGRDAEAQIRAELEAAEADAARIDATAARERADRLALASRGIADELRAAADVRIADATRAARAASLVARGAMLDRALPAIRAQLPGLVTTALVDTALDWARGSAGTLRCAPVLADHARARAPAAIAVVADPAVTGAILELASGARVEATLDAVLDRAWSRIAPEALAWLEVTP